MLLSTLSMDPAGSTVFLSVSNGDGPTEYMARLSPKSTLDSWST
jgi:hypothetical protein